MEQNPEILKTVTLTAQEIADLRHLVSVAVWIRSEQLAQRNVQRRLQSVDPDPALPMPETHIDTRSLVIPMCKADLTNGQYYHGKLTGILERLGESSLQARWRT